MLSFCQCLECEAPLHKLKATPQNRKSPLFKSFSRRFCVHPISFDLRSCATWNAFGLCANSCPFSNEVYVHAITASAIHVFMKNIVFMKAF